MLAVRSVVVASVVGEQVEKHLVRRDGGASSIAQACGVLVDAFAWLHDCLCCVCVCM